MLHGNYSTLSKGPGRFFAGAVGTVEVGIRSGFNKPGANRNRFYIDNATTALRLYSLPQGAYAGTAWLLPQSAGALASQNAQPSVAGAAASGALGRNVVGTAPSTSDASGTGALIVSGSGAAASASGHSAVIQAALGGSGTAVSTAGHSATLQALGWVAGLSSSNAGASLLAYAVGNMGGTSTTATVLSAEGLAAAVWSASASAYNLGGTMGNKLNGAGSAGDPWTTALPGSYAVGQAGYIIGNRLDVALSSLPALTWSYSVRSVTVTTLADVRYVNGVQVKGSGVSGDTWGPV